MNLDDLKQSWKKIGQDAPKLESEAIRQLQHNSSKSPLSKIRKSLAIELIIFVLFMGLIAFNFIKKAEVSSFNLSLIIGIVPLLLMVSTFIFFIRIYNNSKKLSFGQPISNQLRENISALKKDTKYYKWVCIALYFPAILLGTILGDDIGISFDEYFHQKNMYWLFLVAISILLYFPYYLFVNWWIKNFYGQYIAQLEEMNTEISTIEKD